MQTKLLEFVTLNSGVYIPYNTDGKPQEFVIILNSKDDTLSCVQIYTSVTFHLLCESQEEYNDSRIWSNTIMGADIRKYFTIYMRNLYFFVYFV